MIKTKFFPILIVLIASIHPAQAKLESHEVDQLLSCYQQKMKDLKGQAKYNFAISGLPKDDLYKLFIDKDRLENPHFSEVHCAPKNLFDVHEPGYSKAMTQAFQWMSGQIGTQVSLEYLIQLHDLAIDKVRGFGCFRKGLGCSERWIGYSEKDYHRKETLDELFRSRILIAPEQITAELRPHQKPTRYEFYATALMKDHFLARIGNNEESYSVKAIHPHARGNFSKTETLINPFLKHYYQEMNRVHTIRGKLMAMGELIRALEVAHLFMDGNQRTLAFLLLDQLLIENDFVPAILDQPEMFDGYATVAEMADSIFKGMVNFLNETEKFQRDLLQSDCAQLNLAETVMNIDSDSDYIPYYTTLEPLNVTELMREQLENKIKNHIENGGDINHSWPLSPLAQAVITTRDLSLIRSLLDRNAKPLKSISPYLKASSIEVAFELKEFEIVELLLDYLPKDSFEYRHFKHRLFEER